MSIFCCCQAYKTALHLVLSTASTSTLSQEKAASCEFYYCLTSHTPFASWISLPCLFSQTFVLHFKDCQTRFLTYSTDSQWWVALCISTAVTSTYCATHTSLFPAKCKHLFKNVPRFRALLTSSSIKKPHQLYSYSLILFPQGEYCSNNL